MIEVEKSGILKAVTGIFLGISLTTGCGGGGGGGGVPPPAVTPGTSQNIGDRQASLQIEGLPEGTRVYLNGQPQALGTSTFSLIPGNYEVVLSRAGYTHQNKDEFKTIQVGANAELKKSAVFTRNRPPKMSFTRT